MVLLLLLLYRLCHCLLDNLVQWTLGPIPSCFLPEYVAYYVLPGSRAPGSHCLISATSGPARIPLHSAQVMFWIHYSLGVLQLFRQSAFVHVDLPFVLFPLSTLAEHGCYFDFYGTVGL
jgi:hypothetical protein